MSLGENPAAVEEVFSPAEYWLADGLIVRSLSSSSAPLLVRDFNTCEETSVDFPEDSFSPTSSPPPLSLFLRFFFLGFALASACDVCSRDVSFVAASSGSALYCFGIFSRSNRWSQLGGVGDRLGPASIFLRSESLFELIPNGGPASLAEKNEIR